MIHASSREEAIELLNKELNAERDAARFLRAQRFLAPLRKYYLNKQITYEKYIELRRKALSGMMDEAQRELALALGIKFEDLKRK